MALITQIQPLSMNAALEMGGSSKMRSVTREGDSANFSNAALNLAGSGDGLNGSVATDNSSALGGKKATFNFANGALTIGSTTLNLKGFANLAKDDVAVQDDGSGGFNVYKGNQMINVDSSGKMKTKMVEDQPESTKPDGTVVPATEKEVLDIQDSTPRPAGATLWVNNTGASITGDAAANTLFARQAGTSFTGGAVTDKVFAYGGIAGSISTGTGDDAVFTTKITGGTLDLGADNGYVKTKAATGGVVTLGGESIFNADKSALGGVTINAGTDSDKVNVLAKSMSNTKMNFTEAETVAIDVAGGIGTGSNLTLSKGTNSIVAGSISGNNISISTSSGSTTAMSIMGGVSGLTYNSGSDKNGNETIAVKGTLNNSKMNLGDGSNSLQVSGAVTKSSISTGTNANTVFQAASFTGSGTDVLKLGGGGSVVDLKGALAGAAVELGGSNNKLSAGSVRDITMNAGGANATGSNTISISGAATGFNYTGNAGNDNLSIKSTLAKSSIDLGNGNNVMSAGGSVTATSIDAGTTSTNSLTVGSFTGDAAKGITLGGGGNTVKIVGALAGGTVDLGTGANTLDVGRISGTKNNKVTVNMGGSGTETQTLKVSGAASFLTYNGGQGADNLSFQGNVANSTLSLGNGNNQVDLSKTNGSKTTAFDFISSNINAGTDSTTAVNARSFLGTAQNTAAISLGNGNNALNFSGKVGMADVNMGTGGSNTFNAAGISGTKNFSVKLKMGVGGTGDQNVNITGGINYFDYIGSQGDDKLKLLGDVSNSNINVGSGANSITMRGSLKAGAPDKSFNLNNTSISADTNGASSTSVTAGSVTSKGTDSIVLGNGNNTLNFTGKITGTDIDMGTGSNTLYAAGIGGTKTNAVSITMGGAAATGNQTMGITGAVNYMNFVGAGKGDDQLTLLGNLSNSNLDLGSGANSLVMSGKVGKANTQKTFNMSQVGISASGSTKIEAGALTGSNSGGSIINLGGDNNTVALSGNASNFSLSVGGGSNTFTSKSVNNATLNMTAGTSNVTMAGSATKLTYMGSSNADTLNIRGAVNKSSIDLGSGANTLEVGGTAGRNGVYKTYNIGTTNISAGDGGTTIIANSLSGNKNEAYTVSLGNGGTVGNTLDLSGTISNMGSINMGTGANTLNAKSIDGGRNGLVINMGTGASSTTDGNTVNIAGAMNKVTYNGSANDDVMTVLGNMKASTLNLGSGTNSLNMQGTAAKSRAFSINSSTINVSGADAELSLTAGALGGTAANKSKLNLGGGANTLNLKSLANTEVSVEGGLNMTIDTLKGIDLTLGTGSNTITVNKSLGAAGNRGAVVLDLSNTKDGTTQAITVSGAVNNVTYKGGAGNDIINFGNNATNTTVNLGTAGSDSVSTTNATSKTGVLRGVDIEGGGTVSVTVNSMLNSGTRASSITLSGSGDASVSMSGTVTGTRFIMNNTGDTTMAFSGDIKGGANASSKVSFTGATNAGNFTLTGKNMSNTTVDMNSGKVTVDVGDLNKVAMSMGGKVGDIDVTAGKVSNGSDITFGGSGSATLNATSFSASSLNMGAATNSATMSSFGGKNGKITFQSGDSTLTVNNAISDAAITVGTGAGDTTIYSSGLMQRSSMTGGSASGDITLNLSGLEKTNVNLSAQNVALNLTSKLSDSTVAISASGKSSVGTAGSQLVITKSTMTVSGATADVLAKTISGGKVEMEGTNTVLNVGDLNKVNVVASGTNNTVGSAATTYAGSTIAASGTTNVSGAKMESGTVSSSGSSLTINLSGDMTNTVVNLGSGSGTINAGNITGGEIKNSLGTGNVNIKVGGVFGGKTSLSGTGDFGLTAGSMTKADINSAMANNLINVTDGNVDASKVSLTGLGTNEMNITGALTNGSDVLLGAQNGTDSSTLRATQGASDSKVTMKGTKAEIYAASLESMTVDMQAATNLLNATVTTGSSMNTGSGNGAISNSSITMKGTTNELTAKIVSGDKATLNMTGKNTLYATNLGGTATIEGGTASVNLGVLSGTLNVNGTETHAVNIGTVAASGKATLSNSTANVFDFTTNATSPVITLNNGGKLQSQFSFGVGTTNAATPTSLSGVTVGTAAATGNYTSDGSTTSGVRA